MNELVHAIKNDQLIAQEKARRIRAICSRHNLRLPFQYRSFFCHRCKKLIIPGVNARVRVGHRPRALKVTCLECGFVYRKILSIVKR